MPESWKVCIDDSCDGMRNKYICAGSLIGNKESWNKFNKNWRAVLNRHPSLMYFHGKDLPWLKGPFAQFRNKEMYPPPAGIEAAKAKREELRNVIEESDLIGFGVGVLVPEYLRIRDSHPRGKTFMAQDPFEYILQELIYRTTKTIVDHRGAVEVSFVSDSSNRASVYEAVYADWKKWNPKTAKSMRGITHEDDKIHYGLQAADMAASSVNEIYRSHFDSGTVPVEYPLSECFWRIGRIDETYLLDMLEHQSPRSSELNLMDS